MASHKDAVVTAMIGSKELEVEDTNQQFTLTPTNDKIVVRRAGPKQSPSGLTLPENMKGNATAEGEVIATGPGTPLPSPVNANQRRPMQAKVGDKILFHKNSGTEIEVNGEKVLVMNEHDILVILTPRK